MCSVVPSWLRGLCVGGGNEVIESDGFIKQLFEEVVVVVVNCAIVVTVC